MKAHNTDGHNNLEPKIYSELNNNTVMQHQVPVYDIVKSKSQNLSEVSASDSNEDVDNHTYSALDPEAIYTQIPPHLSLGPSNSKTLPIGLKDISPSQLYQKFDRSLSLPRTTGASNSATPGYMLTHAVNRTALALESGNISEADLATLRSDASIKYPSPHGSPKQHTYATLESSVTAVLIPNTRQILNNSLSPKQQRMSSNTSKGDVQVNSSSWRVIKRGTVNNLRMMGQVDLVETDENGNENGKGRQDSTFCGIGRRCCK